MKFDKEKFDLMSLDELKNISFWDLEGDDGKRESKFKARDEFKKYLFARRAKEGDVSSLELEYRSNRDKATKEINKHLKDASEALSRAEEVSERYGVPFYSPISSISQRYYPESAEKFTEIDALLNDFEDELCSPEYGHGWEHSAVC